MSIVVVSDIFGKTKELFTFCESLKLPFEIIDPYSGKQMNFKDESDAYDFFMRNVGLQVYSELIIGVIATFKNPINLLGFSIGATAIWSISENLRYEIIQRSICFYSSQIRDYISITPCIDTDLIFPSFEPRFSVLKVSKCLSKKEYVKVHNTQYLHGFMNKLSKNFSQEGYSKYTDWLRVSVG